MKKIILVLIFTISLLAAKEVNASKISFNQKESETTIKEIIDPVKVCRYYAIMEANQTGYEYGSPAWQQE